MNQQATLLRELAAALAGDGRALQILVSRLTPIVQVRVARVLYRNRAGLAAGRDVQQEVADFCQEVLLVLFADDAKILRSWDAEKGLSFDNFVGLVAERQTLSALRSGRRNPWKDDPTLTEELDARPAEQLPVEEKIASKERLRALRVRLKEELSPQGRWLFDLLFVRERPLPEIASETGLTAEAIYAWRSRLRKLTRRLLEEIQ